MNRSSSLQSSTAVAIQGIGKDEHDERSPGHQTNSQAVDPGGTKLHQLLTHDVNSHNRLLLFALDRNQLGPRLLPRRPDRSRIARRPCGQSRTGEPPSPATAGVRRRVPVSGGHNAACLRTPASQQSSADDSRSAPGTSPASALHPRSRPSPRRPSATETHVFAVSAPTTVLLLSILSEPPVCL